MIGYSNLFEIATSQQELTMVNLLIIPNSTKGLCYLVYCHISELSLTKLNLITSKEAFRNASHAQAYIYSVSNIHTGILLFIRIYFISAQLAPALDSYKREHSNRHIGWAFSILAHYHQIEFDTVFPLSALSKTDAWSQERQAVPVQVNLCTLKFC